MKTPRPLALCALAALAGCAAPRADVPDPGPSADVAPPPSEMAEPAEPAQDPFDYLLERYDVDGDGAVSAAEYTRQEGQFARWDRDGDGRITVDDWASVDYEAVFMSDMGTMQKQRVLGRYFQADEDDAVLRLDEFGESFAAYDADGDLVLTEAELDALADERRRSLPGDGSLMVQSYLGGASDWGHLMDHYDADGSGTLSIEEPGLYLEEMPDGELRFDVDRCDGGAPGDRFAGIDLERGLPEGEPVPELSLPTLRGDERIDLSSFVGDRPVALIFGSYT